MERRKEGEKVKKIHGRFLDMNKQTTNKQTKPNQKQTRCELIHG
jgi:hypothetical protein